MMEIQANFRKSDKKRKNIMFFAQNARKKGTRISCTPLMIKASYGALFVVFCSPFTHYIFERFYEKRDGIGG